MDSVDEALAWFNVRREAIVQLAPKASAREGIDNGGRAVQLDLDTQHILASATVWASGMCLFEAIDSRNDGKVINEAHQEFDASLGALLDGFFDRLAELSR
jgi:hypothetical protein